MVIPIEKKKLEKDKNKLPIKCVPLIRVASLNMSAKMVEITPIRIPNNACDNRLEKP